MKYIDIKHFFTVTPDLFQVKGFADGVEGELKLSWQHPIPHPDPDSDEPPIGTNHLRIEVITTNKPDWKPYFDTAWEQVREYVKENEDVDCMCYLEVFENAINNLQKQIQPL